MSSNRFDGASVLAIALLSDLGSSTENEKTWVRHRNRCCVHFFCEMMLAKRVASPVGCDRGKITSRIISTENIYSINLMIGESTNFSAILVSPILSCANHRNETVWHCSFVVLKPSIQMPIFGCPISRTLRCSIDVLGTFLTLIDRSWPEDKRDSGCQVANGIATLLTCFVWSILWNDNAISPPESYSSVILPPSGIGVIGTSWLIHK